MERTVGLTELKNHLSQYVRHARRGHRVSITDRGRVVAELRPAGPAGEYAIDPGLAELVRRGSVKLGKPNRPGLYPVLPAVVPDGTAPRLIDELRGEA